MCAGKGVEMSRSGEGERGKEWGKGKEGKGCLQGRGRGGRAWVLPGKGAGGDRSEQ